MCLVPGKVFALECGDCLGLGQSKLTDLHFDVIGRALGVRPDFLRRIDGLALPKRARRDCAQARLNVLARLVERFPVARS